MRELLVVYLKGFSMGAADVVPGVSGGTIALIVGVYDRFIRALTALDPREFRPILRIHRADARRSLLETLRRMDAFFLVTLGLGAVSAIVLLSSGMHAAVTEYPVPTYGFFFGLIAASAIVLYGEVDFLTPVREALRPGIDARTPLRLAVGSRRFVVALVGIVLAFVLTGETATNASHGAPMIFLTGAVAICAMVLPGVSGAFLLLVLGQYEYLTGVLDSFVDGAIGVVDGGSVEPVLESGTIVAFFGVGAVIGLFSMAHLVNLALDRYRAATLVFLISLMVGALRLPVVRILENLGDTASGTIPVAVVFGVLGCAAVLLVDRYTDDLEYARE